MELSSPSPRAACTIIARNYLAQARALAASFFAHEPRGRFFVLVVDGLPAGVSVEPAITVLGPDDIGLSRAEFLDLAFKYDVTELSTAVKPALILTILRRYDVQQVVYFDPDILIFRPLDELWRALERASIVLIPHLLDPIPLDGKRPSEQDILTAGAYNLGFLGLHASAEATRFLQWWDERLRDLCRVDVAHGLFVDQKWIDLVPSLYAGVELLRDDTYDVAYWNLHSRFLVRHTDGMLVNGRPLAFFHYSGFDPAKPRELSKHQDRLTVDEGTPLAVLLDQYAETLHRAGYALSSSWPYGYSRFDNGVRISQIHRHLYASLPLQQRRDLGDPFHTGHADSFFQWSARPRPEASSGGLSPFLEQLLVESPDARFAFPEARAKQQKAFLTWAQTHGAEGFGYDPRLADPAVAPTLALEAPGEADGAAARVDGLNVYGYLTNETGLGAIARGFIAALRGRGVPLGLTDLAALSPNRSQDTSLDGVDNRAPYGINLVCVNADQHFVVKSHLGEQAFKEHYNIGVWFWELPTFPAEWHDRFAEYDEVWALSSFIADTLARVSPIPVVRMPPLLTLPRGGSREAGRQHLQVDSATFVFLFIFDFASYFERKNPLAIVEAFQQAFAPTDDVRLVIKCTNEQLDPAAFARLQAQAGTHPVSIQSGYWSADEMHDLIQACDAYVSLHRSEGLGLTMAEAMLAGKPVIATGWSGNTDFMAADNSFPVPFKLVELQEAVGPYPAGAVWAEPQIDEAARLMRLVFDDRELGRTRGQAAQRDLAARFSTEPVGQALEQRLGQIAAKQRGRAAARPPGRREPVAPAAMPLPSVPPMELGGSSHGALGVLVKRGMNFLLRYHTHYQGEINLAFASFMRQLSARQEGQAAETQAVRQHMVRLQQQLEATAMTLYSVRGDVARMDTYFSARPYMTVDAYGTRGDPTAPMGFPHPNPAATTTSEHTESAVPDFADLFRGSEDFIADRQRVYLPFFRDRATVVDLGAGRGEMLELLRQEGMQAVGVELDAAMVERCRARGLHAEHADAFDYLYGRAAESVDVIFSAQFIEHVPSERLPELLEVARARLRPGGLFIAETVNPESYLALKTFFVDLTHQRPIFPQVLLHLVQTAGYRSARIFYPTAGGFTQTQAAYRDAGEYAVVAVK